MNIYVDIKSDILHLDNTLMTKVIRPLRNNLKGATAKTTA